jgi:hypothetical protein
VFWASLLRSFPPPKERIYGYTRRIGTRKAWFFGLLADRFVDTFERDRFIIRARWSTVRAESATILRLLHADANLARRLSKLSKNLKIRKARR